jgi:hypothetical protein
MTSLFYAQAVLAQRGGWFLFLPPYSPDLNPIEMAFAKLICDASAPAPSALSLEGCRRHLRSLRTGRMLELPQSRRICVELNARCSNPFACSRAVKAINTVLSQKISAPAWTRQYTRGAESFAKLQSL